MRVKLHHVHFMPQVLEPGVLYVSREFCIAAHLCACGCGAKISTPIGPMEWRLDETAKGPSLFPSIGNWQLPCRSHYWIRRGEVVWAEQWSQEEVAAGQKQETNRRRAYYEGREAPRSGALRQVWRALMKWIADRR